MNCTVWTCEHCGNINHICDDRCKKCGQAYGSPKKECTKICETAEDDQFNCDCESCVRKQKQIVDER